MFKDTLKISQSVIYQTLQNAFRRQRLSHCYLLTGDQSTPKKETAILMAQSIICPEKQENGFACEECVDCIRIAQGNYFDVIFLDGTNSTIKIEEINKVQEQFEKTALESAGKKVLIIEQAENLTAKSANSLLKFIEEPADNLTIIMTATQVDRLLPTILSRCQVLNFRPLSTEGIYNFALNEGYDSLFAHLAASIIKTSSELAQLKEDPSFNKALIYFTEFMQQLFTDSTSAILYLQDNGFSVNSKNKEEDRKLSKQCLSYFLTIGSIFTNDYLNGYISDDDTYQNILALAKQHSLNASAFLKVICNSQDALLRSSNFALLIDQILYQIREVING